MRFSVFITAALLGSGLTLAGHRATAQTQVDSTGQGRPELNALPDVAAPLPPLANPKQQRDNVAPDTNEPGTFQPARPAQPAAVPAPAKRPVPANAGQQVQTTPVRVRSKWFVAGNPDIGFSSGNGVSYFNIGLATLLGYRITDRLAVGPGLTYQYSSISATGFSRKFSNVGARIFAQGLITDNIFIHAEHEILRAETLRVDLSTYRTTLNSTFAGIGYRQSFGGRTAFDIMALYNFNYSENSFVYGQPEIRFNFLFDVFQ